MSIRIKYAYLSGQVWLYRRNYPEDVQLALGSQALKQSLKTGDAKLARQRSLEVNARYEDLVAKTRAGVEAALPSAPQRSTESAPATPAWGEDCHAAIGRLRAALVDSGIDFSTTTKRPKTRVDAAAKVYLRRRGNELRPGGYKSVRYSVELFASKFGERPLSTLNREDGRLFLSLLPQLSKVLGKSHRTYRMTLDQSLTFSQGRNDRITVRTQKRIWSQVNHFLDWAVYEGEIATNPFRTVRFEGKVRPEPYAVLTDEEVVALLKAKDRWMHVLLLICLFTGMRAGEAAGLVRDDIVKKGNLGSFVMIRPNWVRQLKTDAAERVVPVHPVLEGVLRRLPAKGKLFPDLTVNNVTKRFTSLRDRLGLNRPGLCFHSTRKWFITQCERTGVPEHFTASLVGHKSARSENQLTYGIYSAGISDDQKRAIIDQIRLPAGAEP
ncbi:MAG: tyrosine-type recombinase/integrase [Rhodobacterales bacterium]|nr:tyrosine-type recombinase/integrase [Rhodobacterales bacterium]